MDVCTALHYNAELRQRHWSSHTDNRCCAEPICIPTAASGCLSTLCPGIRKCNEAWLHPLPLLERLGTAESLNVHAWTQIKQGDPREAASLANSLLTTGQPLEVQHFGFQLLQSVVSNPCALQASVLQMCWRA